jgi:hypothetical protein
LFAALGITAAEDGVLRLTVAADEWAAADSVESFRRLLNFRLMEVTAHGEAARGTLTFCSAIAWFLAQDPLRPIEKWNGERHGEGAERLQQQNLAFGERLIKGPTQWRSFASWVAFLGFAEQVRIEKPTRFDLLVPDPTAAIQAALAPSGESTAREFLANLGSSLPVLDQGVIRRAVEAKWQGDPPPGPVSPALSVALLRLDAIGALKLMNVADSPPSERIVLHTGTEDRIVSSVVVGN